MARFAKNAVEHDERGRLLVGDGGLDAYLASLETLEQLNALLAPHNITLRKKEVANGRSELLEAGTTLLEIPPCSESAGCLVCVLLNQRRYVTPT